jgi:hypothetical protein
MLAVRRLPTLSSTGQPEQLLFGSSQEMLSLRLPPIPAVQKETPFVQGAFRMLINRYDDGLTW